MNADDEFFAVAVLQQVAAGAFSLDTSVTAYLGLDDTTVVPEVTPYHLLTHTSGIGDDADEEDGVAYGRDLAVRADLELEPVPRAVRARRPIETIETALRADLGEMRRASLEPHACM